MTMDEPWARVICLEPDDGRIVLLLTDFDYVATDGVFVIVHRRPSAANDRERVLERMFGRD